MRLKKRVVSSLVSIVTALSLSYGVANADLILKKDGSKIYNYYYHSENLESITVSNGKEKLDIPKKDIKDYVYTKQDINEETALLLEKVKAIEDWGEEKIGVPKSDNYLIYDKSFETLHILLYCQELEIPKTYFDLEGEYFKTEEEALARQEELEAQGYDVYYRTAESVANDSTISQELLDADLFRELFVILHENTHDFVDFPIDLDEAAANIAGYYGALDYIKEKHGKKSEEYKYVTKFLEKHDKNDELVNQYYDKIKKLYESNISKEEKIEKRDEILEELRIKQCFLWETLVPPINVPELVSDATYARYGPLFKKVYEKAGSTKEAVKVFKGLSDKIKWIQYMYDEDYTRDYCTKHLENYINS